MKATFTRILILVALSLHVISTARATRTVVLVPSVVDSNAKPLPPPPRWLPLIGEYVLDKDTVIVLEKDGTLCALFNRGELAPLQEVSVDSFDFIPPASRAGRRLEFLRGVGGKVTGFTIANQHYKRR